ncbi:MFS transporter [Rhodovibrionaceae bacterium A322]
MAALDNTPPSWREFLRGKELARLVLLCFGVWLYAADGLMVATIIPDIITGIGGATYISWTLSLYEVGSIVAGAAAALLALRFGLRWSLTLAALLYMAGCLLSAVAPDMVTMLVGRLMQGLGGGAMVALSFLATTRFFSVRAMPRVMAAISLVWGLSAFSGPLVGGIFSELGNWRGAFYFFAIQAVLLAAWNFWGLKDQGPADRDEQTERFPINRLLLLSGAVMAIALASINVEPVRSSLLVLTGLVLLGLFLRLDSRKDGNRLLPRRTYDPRTVAGSALGLMCLFCAGTTAYFVYGPVVMVTLFGVTALTAGYVLATSSISWSLLAIVASGLPERFHNGAILLGMSSVTISLFGFMWTLPNGPLWLIVFFAFLEGGGFGLAYGFIMQRATSLTVDEEKERLASALPTIQHLGYALGAAFVGIAANAAGFSDSLSKAVAADVGFWVFVASVPLALLGLTLTWIFIRQKGATAAD